MEDDRGRRCEHTPAKSDKIAISLPYERHWKEHSTGQREPMTTEWRLLIQIARTAIVRTRQPLHAHAQTRSAEGRLHADTASKPTRLEISSPVEPSKTQNPHPTSSLRQCDTRLLHVPGCALQTRVHVSSARGAIAFVWRGSLWHLGDAPSQSLRAHGWVSQCKNWFGTRNPGRVEGADAMRP
jgi:hypothetical protein